jgi:hypothetical protein
MASQRWLTVCSSKIIGVPPNSSVACGMAAAALAQRLPFIPPIGFTTLPIHRRSVERSGMIKSNAGGQSARGSFRSSVTPRPRLTGRSSSRAGSSMNSQSREIIARGTYCRS